MDANGQVDFGGTGDANGQVDFGKTGNTNGQVDFGGAGWDHRCLRQQRKSA